MDILRVGSTYETDAKFFSDSDELLRIKWHMCPPNAKIFPGPHAFGSLIWSDADIKPGKVGEQSRKRTWAKNENNRGYLGQCYTGERDWFRFGIPKALATSVPECPGCATRTLGGGFLLGGRSTQKRLDAQLGDGGLLLGGRSTSFVSVGQAGLGGLLLGGDSTQLAIDAQLGLGGLRLGGRSTSRVLEAQIGLGGLRLGGRSVQFPGFRSRAGLLLGGRSHYSYVNGQMGLGGLLLGGRDGTPPSGHSVVQSSPTVAFTGTTGTVSFTVDPTPGNSVVLNLISLGDTADATITDSEGNTYSGSWNNNDGTRFCYVFAWTLPTFTSPYVMTVNLSGSSEGVVSAQEVTGVLFIDNADNTSDSGTSAPGSNPVFVPAGDYISVVYNGLAPIADPSGFSTAALAGTSAHGGLAFRVQSVDDTVIVGWMTATSGPWVMTFVSLS